MARAATGTGRAVQVVFRSIGGVTLVARGARGSGQQIVSESGLRRFAPPTAMTGMASGAIDRTEESVESIRLGVGCGGHRP
jgi:hypothetical protein